ncbi:hypothetical protein [Rosenbergiella australiborealis]|uniref:hypothetical protein n=1 Tax=Rosenbergiella australiborealis TaxID=1544696 RepID=UPI001F4E6196|nr:hypothetical protein [Rosenbergiella australiborealis]
MIALTQEKREELISDCKILIREVEKAIAKFPDDAQLKSILTRQELALASLTTAAVLHAVDSDVEDKIYTALCNEHEVGAYPLYTAPPVPEIKLPPEFNESHDSFNEFRRGWNGAISEVKRTNGLGE